ncbi:MAG: 30S ribosomal protein S12 methylthiotransferase RimO [Proteobacteria bacterium]|nr:30S ribosomal protein S12 methylthiotransferase RimO [Pseudomonadota bacterium]
MLDSSTSASSSPKKIHLISLGCSRNRVDSEVMVGTLLNRGWVSEDDPVKADAVIVNTCGFIASAKEESIDTILSMAEHKKENPNLKIIVAGCLTQRYKGQLAKGLPEVDFFVGTDEFHRIGELLTDAPERGAVMAKRTHYLYNEDMPRVNTLSKHSAYVKVAEGCQHNCAFCIIPAIRGKLRSRPVHSVTKEVMKLVDEGVKEINLIAQDLAAYGRDTNETNLLELLKTLVKIEGLDWIRLLYVYPENISEDFLEFFAKEEKIVKYLDIPVQHGSNSVLKRMNRDVTREQIRDTVNKLRQKVPSVAIRTSVMVGFPGESESEFQDLKNLVEELKFDHLGCFSYSQEEGTVAGRMPDQIAEDVKQNRLDQIMMIQKSVSKERLKRFVGQRIPVLVSGPSEESELLWQGRMAIQAPEVDGLVYLNDGPLEAGQIQMVEITDSYEYDLVGHVVS